MQATEYQASHQAPIFLVSPRYRKEMAGAIEAIGRTVTAVRWPEETLRRFEQSSSLIVVIDARGALQRGLSVARELSHLVEQRRGAMIVLLSRGDNMALADIYDGGATHFLMSPFGTAEFGQMLRFVDRYVRRMHMSGASDAVVSAHAALSGAPRWEWTIGDSHATISPSLAELLGQPPGTRRVNVAEALDNIEPSSRSGLRRALRRLLRAGVSGDVDHVAWIDGRPHKIMHHVRIERQLDGTISGLAATVEDFDAVLLDRRMSAHFDTLTGLANQAYARAWIDQLLGGRSAFNPACIVVLLAISRFDQINAGHGRAIADALLQAVGRRLRRLAGEDRDRVLMARLAGAEFAVAFAGPVVLKDVIFFSQQVGEAFERPFVVGGRVVHLACRMGIAVADSSLDGAETLFRRASAALAQAKGNEPNSFQVFLSNQEGDAHARMASLETDLRRSIESDELEILYQPQVEIASNRITGVEALVRWQHPVFGTLSAETLLDVAESAEFSTRIGEHILRKALGEAASWQGELKRLRLSVNVTAADMRQTDFDKMVLMYLAESGYPADRFTIEVTEGGLMENLEHVSQILVALREQGVRVAIDDFGTGYSSLAYLKSLPLDYLKVDKKLVTDLGGSARDRVVVRGIVDMARSLGMGVVAEGVENVDQLESLVREGCNWYQGYLCAAPMPGADLARFVEDWHARHPESETFASPTSVHRRRSREYVR